MPTFEACRAGYGNLWRAMTVRADKIAAADRVAKGIVADRARYEKIEAATGVPWFLVAILHERESGRNFSTYLGNGQPLNRMTTIVPVGRGPFASFEAGAADALKLDGLAKVADWPVERIGYEMERFNGWGYLGKCNSPYLWAGSNLYTAGKYIADHKFSATAVDKQLGGMVVLSRLAALCPDVAARIGRNGQNGQSESGAEPEPLPPLPPPPDIPKPDPVPPAPPRPRSLWAALAGLLAGLFGRR